MKKAISNSGPLIHLSSVGLIDYLFHIFDLVIIPKEVYNELVVQGKKKDHADALIIEQMILSNKIQVKELKNEKSEIFSSRLHPGELDAIRLALIEGINLILLDDDEARIFAKDLKLKVKGTLGLLINFLELGYLNLNEAINYLRKLNSIMYLSADVYIYVEDYLKQIES